MNTKATLTILLCKRATKHSNKTVKYLTYIISKH